jgi:hypothetical protein
MKRVSAEGKKGTGKSFQIRRKAELGSSVFCFSAGKTSLLLFLGMSCLLFSACSVGTGDVELSIVPDTITYTGLTEWVRAEFQVYGKRVDNGHPAEGFQVQVSSTFSPYDCASPAYSQFFQIEDVNRKPVNCQWSTQTGDDGNLRFFVTFLGSSECFPWSYSVSVFGEEGTYGSASVENCCEQIDPVTGDVKVVCPSSGG